MDGWLGLAGWRWIFLLEGLPPLVIGICALFFLPDGPSDAKWLSSAEKQALLHRLEEEHPPRLSVGGRERQGIAWAQVCNARTLMLAAAYFSIQASGNTLGIWTPQIVKEVLGGTNRALLVSAVTAVPALCAVIVMPLVSAHSDRRKRTRLASDGFDARLRLGLDRHGGRAVAGPEAGRALPLLQRQLHDARHILGRGRPIVCPRQPGGGGSASFPASARLHRSSAPMSSGRCAT